MVELLCVWGVWMWGGDGEKSGIGSPLLSSMILLSGGRDRNSFRVASHSCYMYRHERRDENSKV